jgi:hypothetical protein
VALHYRDLVRQLLWRILSRNSRVMSFVLKRGANPTFAPLFVVLRAHNHTQRHNSQKVT